MASSLRSISDCRRATVMPASGVAAARAKRRGILRASAGFSRVLVAEVKGGVSRRSRREVWQRARARLRGWHSANSRAPRRRCSQRGQARRVVSGPVAGSRRKRAACRRKCAGNTGACARISTSALQRTFLQNLAEDAGRPPEMSKFSCDSLTTVRPKACAARRRKPLASGLLFKPGVPMRQTVNEQKGTFHPTCSS